MPILSTKKIILASNSPRRHELLSGLDLSFDIFTKSVEETYPSTLELHSIPEYLAVKKAKAYTDLIDEETIIITADTVVIHQEKVLEKPTDEQDAIAMIEKLAGDTHEVVTGVCVQTIDGLQSFSDLTRVKFMPISTEEIKYYVNKYKPYDKAGAYGVQEWIGYIGIERLEGSYYNVMGLPVHKLYQVLKELN